MNVSRLIGTVVAFASMLTLGPVYAQVNGPDSFVLTEKDAVGLLPPVLVAGPEVVSAQWSSDGHFVIVQRMVYHMTPDVLKTLVTQGERSGGPPPGEMVLTVWDAKTQQSKDVWKQRIGLGNIERVEWMPRSSIALAIVSSREPPKDGQQYPDEHRGVLRINAETETVKVLAAPYEYFDLHVSPTDPVALISISAALPRPAEATAPAETRTAARFKTVITPIRENGTFGTEIELAPSVFPASITWSQDGSATLHCTELPAVKGTKAVIRRFALDPMSGKVKPLETEPAEFHAEPRATDITLKEVVTAAKEGITSRNLSLLWLEGYAKSEQPRALVGANVHMAQIGPRASGVLYVSNGVAWVSPLLRIPKEMFAALRDKARTMVVLNNAKQLALGLMMYCQDYDEVLPTGDGINAKIEPYLKNDSLFDGFTYTFGGGALASIEKPAETELGYVNGPGGRAIMYVDGHVKWKKD